jgi:hypothetical protein
MFVFLLVFLGFFGLLNAQENAPIVKEARDGLTWDSQRKYKYPVVNLGFIDTIVLGGMVDFQLGTDFYSPEEKSILKNASQNLIARSNFALNLDVKASSDWVDYGAQISLIAGKNASYDEGGANLNRAFIFTSIKDGGRSEVGITKIATEKMRVDSSTFAVGTGGINGDWFRFANLPILQGYNFQPAFLLTPRMMISSGFSTEQFLGSVSQTQQVLVQPRLGWGDDAIKLSYYSSRINGFKFGLSFLPSANDRFATLSYATNTYNEANQGMNLQNAIGLGVNYAKQIDNLTISTSLLSESGAIRYNQADLSTSNNSLKRRNLTSVSGGVNLSYAGLHFGGSYSNFGDSFYYRQSDFKGNNSKNAYQYNVGTGYSFGPYAVSLGFLQSQFMSNRLRNAVFSAQRLLAGNKDRQFKQYFELSSYQMSYLGTSNERLKRDGAVLITGFKLEF